MSDHTSCPACGSNQRTEFFTWPQVPVNSCLLLDDQSEAESFPTGELALVHCHDCGFIANDAFRTGLNEYSDRYDATQGYSPRFMDFANELAKRWVERYDLRGKHVVEIGSGEGEFLVAMAQQGIGSGVGIDPGAHPERVSDAAAERVTWVSGWFPEDLPDLSDAAAVVCRHTLEHIGPVRDFVQQIRSAMGPESDAVVLFELPDALRVLREGAFWDTYYEHCSYFTAGSLVRLFLRCGFDVISVEMAYDDQYLLLEARALPEGQSSEFVPADDLQAITDGVEHFRTSVNASTAHWTDRIREIAGQGGVVTAWGGGSKAVAFLAQLGEHATSVSAVVDVNPYKHNHYLAGTGHKVISPQELTVMRPDLVVVMNPVYIQEISDDLEALGLSDAVVEAL